MYYEITSTGVFKVIGAIVMILIMWKGVRLNLDEIGEQPDVSTITPGVEKKVIDLFCYFFRADRNELDMYKFIDVDWQLKISPGLLERYHVNAEVVKTLLNKWLGNKGYRFHVKSSLKGPYVVMTWDGNASDDNSFKLDRRMSDKEFIEHFPSAPLVRSLIDEADLKFKQFIKDEVDTKIEQTVDMG